MTQETTRSTGKWCQVGVPHKGWTFVGYDDLGESSAICEMCETQEIRYVHYMEHPNYPTQLGCGCVCAGGLKRLMAAAELVTITERIAACRDPTDDKFLELAVNGHADLIVSGDADLLVLNPFRDVPIVTSATFVQGITR